MTEALQMGIDPFAKRLDQYVNDNTYNLYLPRPAVATPAQPTLRSPNEDVIRWHPR